MSPDAPPPPPPIEAPAPEPAAEVQAVDAGQRVLDSAVDALSRGEYEEAIAIAIPAVSRYPGLAPSFQAVADVAADQLARRREGPVAGPDPYAGYTPPAGYYPYGYPPRRRARMMGGVELGAPTGFRIEWKLAGRAVDAWGFRIGGNLALYGGIYPAFELLTFFDFTLGGDWQLEASGGISAPYPGFVIGAAAQWDPETPMFVNLGGRVGAYGLSPDITVGWVW